MTPLRPADRVPFELPFDVKLGGLPEFGGFEVTEWIDEGPWDEAGDPLLALLTRGIPGKGKFLKYEYVSKCQKNSRSSSREHSIDIKTFLNCFWQNYDVW